MADAQKIIPGIIIGIVVTIAGTAFKTYMERPPTLSADVLATPYAAPFGQAPANATCLLSVNVENNTHKPARQIQIHSDYAIAYSMAPQKKAMTTGSISKDQPAYVIDVLNPGSSRRVFVFTTYPCDFTEPLGHPGMRVFNDEGSATVRNIVPPSGWMLIYTNEYYFASLPLLALGILIIFLIVVGGIVDGLKKLSEISTPKSPEPPAAPST